MFGKKKLTWGIAGCGRIAPNHAWSARELGARLLWACDLKLEKAQKFAENHGIEKATADVQDLLDDPDLDVLVVATDHGSHIPIATRALHKKGVLIEKPLGVPQDDLPAFLQKVEQGNAVVGVISQHRYSASINRIAELLRQGAFGEIELLRATTISFRGDGYYANSFWRGTLQHEGGSHLINQGYHALDTLVYLFGIPEVRASRCWTYRKEIMETEEALRATLEFPGGIPAEIYGTNARGSAWEVVLEIHGSKGHVIFDLAHPDNIRSSDPEIDGIPKPKDPPPGIPYYGTSHREAVEDFFNCVRKGKTTRVTPAIAAGTLQIISQIYTMGNGAQPQAVQASSANA